MFEQPAAAWHWPSFAAVICGSMTDRERLGLPEHYVPDRFAAERQTARRTLRARDVPYLARLCEDEAAPLPDRLAAGDLLALLGDPRIVVHDPAMATIEGGVVEIGLVATELDAVLARYRPLGLNRTWFEKECPRHAVRLKPYAIAKYPVTNAEFRDYLLATGDAELPSSWRFRRFPAAASNHPVYTVSPRAADAYAAWLSGLTGRRFRLPTEAEWEYAAAGPEGLEFPWGDGFDADKANTAEAGLFETSAVGAFAGGNSPFGVCDMAGNVEEYTADDYRAYPGGAAIFDDLTGTRSAYRVARGGSFARFRDLARTRRRHGQNPSSETYAMGFRLAEDLADEQG